MRSRDGHRPEAVLKRAALYMRVSTLDQHPETQLVWASDRIARSVKRFFDVLDELNRLNIEFSSFREQIDTGGPLGRAVVVILGAIAELERNLIIERVRAGVRRARLEGRHIGRPSLELDPAAILRAGSAARASASWPRAIASPAPPFTACSASTPQLTWRNRHEHNHRPDHPDGDADRRRRSHLAQRVTRPVRNSWGINCPPTGAREQFERRMNSFLILVFGCSRLLSNV